MENSSKPWISRWGKRPGTTHNARELETGLVHQLKDGNAVLYIHRFSKMTHAHNSQGIYYLFFIHLLNATTLIFL